mmetsp:Transcript_93044/g.182295  ORF Transcript_93044/g.182295 Transcript_93044/m.182295 type:complete len:87 (+) Transcript_93044:599-859(+)
MLLLFPEWSPVSRVGNSSTLVELEVPELVVPRLVMEDSTSKDKVLFYPIHSLSFITKTLMMDDGMKSTLCYRSTLLHFATYMNNVV